ncbi:MAG: Shedu immune nuclease family protein, partial [Solirubrobacterales bacterium]
QTRTKSEDWQDVKTVPLNRLKAGEGVYLELKSEEILHLHRCLAALYEEASHAGVEIGTKRLIPVNQSRETRTLLQTLDELHDKESLTAVLRWLAGQDAQEVADILNDHEISIVEHLSAMTGVARLKNFLRIAEENIQNGDEKFWQKLIVDNSWALSQLVSSPIVIVRREAYLGGKSIHGRGGNVADFLYRNSITDNATIVEIKTPLTDLTGAVEYRNNAYAPSPELAGAVQQVLQDLYSLRDSYSSLRGDKDPDFRIFSPRLLLVVGSLRRLKDVDKVRSFELFRKSIPDIDIVTFDELIEKARTLVSMFSGQVRVADESAK